MQLVSRKVRGILLGIGTNIDGIQVASSSAHMWRGITARLCETSLRLGLNIWAFQTSQAASRPTSCVAQPDRRLGPEFIHHGHKEILSRSVSSDSSMTDVLKFSSFSGSIFQRPLELWHIS
jgi:hypothetical protein